MRRLDLDDVLFGAGVVAVLVGLWLLVPLGFVLLVAGVGLIGMAVLRVRNERGR